MAGPKWEIRGASSDLRKRVNVAAAARPTGQGAWVVEAIEAHLTEAPSNVDIRNALDELGAIGAKLNQVLARLQDIDQRIEQQVARAVAAALSGRQAGGVTFTLKNSSRPKTRQPKPGSDKPIDLI